MWSTNKDLKRKDKMTTEEQREEHTARTIEAIGIIKDAFAQIDKMQILINDKDLQIQDLQNALLMARSLKSN